MGRRILVIAAVLILAGLAWVSYKSYDAHSNSNGDVYSNDPPSTKGKAGSAASDSESRPETFVYPTAQSGTASDIQATGTSAPTGQITRPTASNPGVAATDAPATDTISPNPPNGMVFAGKGRYQLYRQGNITWRLDTDNGRTCIIFATLEEWKKPQVIRAGCGTN